MNYFTRQGDRGKSKIGYKKYSKDSLFIEVLGELDELNSLIGLAKNYLPQNFTKSLTEIQNSFFIIQANIAFFIYKKFKPPKLKKNLIVYLELMIEKIEEKIKPSHKFVIYGSNKNSAWFDYLRSKTRTVERRIISFNKKFKVQPEILAYFNRLSSYFYALARLAAFEKKSKEIEPWY